MEKSYGIEAARAQLGDIADHARTTGQTIALTRHGRTVAVIGPATSVKPSGGVEVTLFYPHDQRTCVLPALPRLGEIFVEEVAFGEGEEDEAIWRVDEVRWHMATNGHTTVGVSLMPFDEHTQMVIRRQVAMRRLLAADRDTEK